MRLPVLASGLLAMILGATAPRAGAAQELPRPAASFGFEPGADYQLADYEQMIAYYRQLDAATDRVQMMQIGHSARGHAMYLVIVSSEQNMKTLERWRGIAERLQLGRIAPEEATELAREGRAIVWIDGGLDDQEYATGQMMPALVYRIANENSEEMRKIRDNVVALLMPHMNPEASHNDNPWYRQTKGTPFETTEPPRLGQPFVGTDNNRDWFMITQPETWAASRIFYHVWHPQIIYNHHQTGESYARITIPPYSDPVNPDIHPGVVAGVNMAGTAMASRYALKHMPGYVARVVYDMWWNGGMRLAPYYHNQIGILTETSHRWPSPYSYDTTAWPQVLSVRKGDAPRTDGTSIFHPYPWKGAESHFGDAIRYMVEGSIAVLNMAANYREELQSNIYSMARDAIEAGEAGNPYAYLVPPDQWDPSAARDLLNVFWRGAVEVRCATQPFQAAGHQYPANTYVLYAAQAFRPLIMNLLEPQRYPDRRVYPGGPPEPPYDLSGWTLPMQMGVHVVRVNQKFTATTVAVDDSVPTPAGQVTGTATFGYALSPRPNASAKAVNRLLAAGVPVHRATSPFTDGGTSYDVGTFVVERSGRAEPQVRLMAQAVGVDFAGLVARPNGLTSVRPPRIGLYASWVPQDDEGWTLWLLQGYGFPVDTLHDADVKAGNLSGYTAIVIPSQAADGVLNGHPPGTMPPAYVGGLGAAGVAALQRYVQAGGTLVTFDAASDFAIQELGLPLRNVVAGVPQQEFFIPGSLLRATIDVSQPLAYGMQPETAVSFQRSQAFEIVRFSKATEGGRVEIPDAPAPPVDVIVRYAPDHLLMSGWAIGEQRYLAGRPAMVRVRQGRGHVVLFAFRPQFRSQPRGTYKLIFNALFAAPADGR